MATVEMKVRPEDLTSVPQGHERIPDPGIMVIFGASGDLTKRKLLPALFHLEQSGLLPKNFAIVGVARRPLGNEFADDMRAGIVESGVDNSDPKLEEFAKKISYYALSFDDASHYAGLKAELDRIAAEKGIGPDRLFYLATAPEYFEPIVENLGKQGMAQPAHGRVGVVIEKPFGHDLESAKALNHNVNAVFHENQVFRIDHYLGKETVQNILVFRFANGIFEPVWNRNYIDSCADYGGGDTGRGRPRAVLREGRRVARRDPEPRDGAAQLHRHGAAFELRRRGGAARKGEGVAGDPKHSDSECGARAVWTGRDRRQESGRLSR